MPKQIVIVGAEPGGERNGNATRNSGIPSPCSEEPNGV